MRVERTLGLKSFSQFYFTGGASQITKSTSSKDGIAIIRTGDHFTKCERAVRPHRMDSYMICLILGGEGIYKFNSEVYYLKKNTICFIPPCTLVSWQSQTSFQSGFCCTFSETFFNQGQENKSWLQEQCRIESNVLLLSERQTSYFATLLEDMLDDTAVQSSSNNETVRIQLHLMMRKLAALIPQKQNYVKPHNKAAVSLALAFLKHGKDDFEQLLKGAIDSLPTLTCYAERLYVTPNHLNDTIKAVIGQSVGQYLYQELITHANSLLRQTNLNINEIATRLGFKDASYFARFYKKQTQITPSAFREKSVDNTNYSV